MSDVNTNSTPLFKGGPAIERFNDIISKIRQLQIGRLIYDWSLPTNENGEATESVTALEIDKDMDDKSFKLKEVLVLVQSNFGGATVTMGNTLLEPTPSNPLNIQLCVSTKTSENNVYLLGKSNVFYMTPPSTIPSSLATYMIHSKVCGMNYSIVYNSFNKGVKDLETRVTSLGGYNDNPPVIPKGFNFNGTPNTNELSKFIDNRLYMNNPIESLIVTTEDGSGNIIQVGTYEGDASEIQKKIYYKVRIYGIDY